LVNNVATFELSVFCPAERHEVLPNWATNHQTIGGSGAKAGGLEPPTARNVVKSPKPPTDFEPKNERMGSRRWKKHRRAPRARSWLCITSNHWSNQIISIARMRCEVSVHQYLSLQQEICMKIIGLEIK
jgi:hypothetical protein